MQFVQAEGGPPASHCAAPDTPFTRWVICPASSKKSFGRSLVETVTTPVVVRTCVVYGCSAPACLSA